MADKLIYILNDDTKKTSCRAISGWNVWTLNLMNQPIQQGSSKLMSQRLRKRHYKTLGTSVINSPMSPSSLHTYTVNTERRKERIKKSKKKERIEGLILKRKKNLFSGVRLNIYPSNAINKNLLHRLQEERNR